MLGSMRKWAGWEGLSYQTEGSPIHLGGDGTAGFSESSKDERSLEFRKAHLRAEGKKIRLTPVVYIWEGKGLD